MVSWRVVSRREEARATPRKPARPTAEALDQFCAPFDDRFSRLAARDALRH
jgi:hypothetical protein